VKREMTKLQALWWRIRNFMWGFTVPLPGGKSISVHSHHWTGFKFFKYKGECTCLDIWFMWFVVCINYGTCNFDELEKKWFGLDEKDEGEDQ
jgi:hypothetical protein